MESAMPTVTLVQGNKYALGTYIFENGVPQECDPATAAQLRTNPRFKVEGPVILPQATQSAAEDNRAFIAQVAEAIDQLDEDDESNFTKDGKPDARALAKLVGRAVTSEERDAAMRYQQAQDGAEVGRTAPMPAPPKRTATAKPKATKKAAAKKIAKPKRTQITQKKAAAPDASTEGARNV